MTTGRWSRLVPSDGLTVRMESNDCKLPFTDLFIRLKGLRKGCFTVGQSLQQLIEPMMPEKLTEEDGVGVLLEVIM